jgi:AcrR family transcriptional regulator
MSNSSSLVDRRVRKTRTALFSAMEELLSENSFDSISVTDVCRRADVNRATFYLHFDNTRELLLQMVEHLLRELTESFRPVETDNRGLERPPEQMVKVFRSVKAHAVLYRTILQDGGLAPFDPRLVSRLREIGFKRLSEVAGQSVRATGRAEREIVVHGAVGAFLGIISWWIVSGMHRSPEYMAERAGWPMISGSYALLGLTPPTMGQA